METKRARRWDLIQMIPNYLQPHISEHIDMCSAKYIEWFNATYGPKMILSPEDLINLEEEEMGKDEAETRDL